MKYTKILMLALAATAMASCSNDEDFNGLSTTVGFQKTEVAIKESAGSVNIPIEIKGYRNGHVSLEVVAEGTGANPAKEGENFRIVDNTLTLRAENDTTDNAILNVQLETIDDAEINEPREVTLTIKSVNGASLDAEYAKIVVTLRDNDAAFYEKFFGKWTMSFFDSDDNPVSKTVTISGAVDEEDEDYDNILWVSAPSLFNVGVALNCEWPMQYTYDKETKTGTLSHLMYQNYVATYGTAYQWVFVTDDGASYTNTPVTTEWALGENDEFPTTISWTEDQNIWLYQPGAGWWDLMYGITLTKQ